ncbi:MAG: N-acetylmuramoyl-L-alanine amidase [Myxococcota bacterium]
MVSRKQITPVALLFLAAACAQQANTPTRLSGTSPLVETFVRAASEADVPADFLAAWSHLETRFQLPEHHEHTGEEDAHGPRSYGVMGLTDDQIARATALTGDAEDTIRHDVTANVRAAAFLLRNAADTHGRIEGNLTAGSSPVAWADAMADGRGIPHASMKDAYTRMVARVVGNGLTGTDGDGLTIVLEGRGEVRIPARTVIHNDLDPQDPYSARYVQAAHYTSGRSGQDIDMVVIHTMQGSYSGSVSWFQNPDSAASAHYCINSEDGEITQMVRLENTAWHAGHGTTNRRSVGIEHEGYIADPGRWYTDVMYEKSAQLTRWLADRYNIPIDRQHIIGHREVPGCSSGGGGGASCHTDPGTGWDWTRFMDLVRNGSGGGSSSSTSSSGGTGSGMQLVGVTYDASQGTTARIAGATVTVSQNGNNVATATSSSTGFWSFDLGAGTYTISASASGFQTATRDGTVSTAGQNWASIGLTPGTPAPQVGTYRGVIYSGPNLGDDPVEGATVTLSTGQTGTTSATGSFMFDNVPVGTFTATATKEGYTSASVTRTVTTAGEVVWGSMRIEVETPEQPQGPGTPSPISPSAGAVVDGANVILTWSRVTDPANADVAYDVEVYLDSISGAPLLTQGTAQPAGSPVTLSLAAPLEAGNYAWRVRARSINGTSAWSDGATFAVEASSGTSTSSSAGGPSTSSTSSTSSSSSSSSTSGGGSTSSGEVGPGTSSTSGGGGNSGGGGGVQNPPADNGSAGDGTSDGGCSASHAPTSGVPFVGASLLLLGLMARRRRR